MVWRYPTLDFRDERWVPLLLSRVMVLSNSAVDSGCERFESDRGTLVLVESDKMYVD